MYRYIYCLSCSFTSADTNVSLLPQLQVFWMPLRPLRGFARLRLFNCKPVSIVKKTVHPLSTMWLLACTTLQGLTCSHYREKLGKPPHPYCDRVPILRPADSAHGRASILPPTTPPHSSLSRRGSRHSPLGSQSRAARVSAPQLEDTVLPHLFHFVAWVIKWHRAWPSSYVGRSSTTVGRY